MLSFHTIQSWDDPRLSQLLSLYQDSFPVEERRELTALQRLMTEESAMHLCAVESPEHGLIGLFIYWTFEGFNYFEHLAVFPKFRNLRLGAQILQCAHDLLSGPCLLEVEPAHSNAMSERRIGFYERNGYQIVDQSYLQPSYRSGEDDVPLWIMAHRFEDDSHTLSTYLQCIRQRVYVDQR